MARPRKDRKHFTTGEAANYLNIPRRTLTKYCAEGKIDAQQHPVTKQWQITETSLIDFQNKHGLESNSSDDPFKILIVDDEPSVVATMMAILERSDLNVTVDSSQNGYEGLLKIGQFLPDLVILDIRMPKMDGNEVLRALKNDEKTKNIVVLVATGYPAELKEEYKPVIDGLIPKPFTANHLKEQVGALLLTKVDGRNGQRVFNSNNGTRQGVL